ncbi:MAG: adenylate/guanylate cyclase domain-containing protein [Treponema sp.]|nr:adenylate/guanylate cyclase domain-containing protein [Treponema sp.]
MKKIQFFNRVGKTRIIPIGLKILLIFIMLILLSNFATNFITIQLTRKQIVSLNNTVMVDRLKDLYTNASNQYQIYQYSQKIDEVEQAMTKSAESGFDNENSIALAIEPTGKISFMACANPDLKWNEFSDTEALSQLNAKRQEGISEGSMSFDTEEGSFFGVYKYQKDWNYYLVRAELRKDTERNTLTVYKWTSIIIAILTVFFIIIGYLILNREFQGLRNFTNDLFKMQTSQEMGLIDISKAPNDDITYMAASFNALSATVNNLLLTFKKFVSKDVVAKAYSDHCVNLEGTQKELCMLFSDIKSFTYRTETLGNDIIDVLNVHYDRVIHEVHEQKGVIGSIIGDAVLAVYGTLDSNMSKSCNAIMSAWGITRVTAELRASMAKRREEIETKRQLTESEERVYQAVLLDVGVGIDGGKVFYGNIGSSEHMANTVIGDNVNSASRLEGLTRVYKLPVIVSGYIKDEVENETQRYKFYEIDTVQVKGKTEGKKIYFPFDTEEMDNALLAKYDIFEKGLEAYYSGDWKTARREFKDCGLDVTEVFLERMGNKNAPEDWSGIWTMTTK